MVEAAKYEALEAVDHYNRPLAGRGLEGFFMHMHTAWLYLLQAELHRDHIDYRYWKEGRVEKVQGEDKRWDLARCTRQRWSDEQHPVRANVELTVAIRNKVEHRWTEGLTLLVCGRAQALLLNFDRELVEEFGENQSLGDSLRFPVFIGALTKTGAVRLAQEQAKAGKAVRRLIARFEEGLNDDVLQDQRFEVRVHLLQRSGPKSEADLAIEFIRAEDLSDAQRQQLADRQGSVIVREVERPVLNAGWMKPTEAAMAVETGIPFQFRVHPHFTTAWRKLKVRPPKGDSHPAITKQDLCQYDKPHKDYLYSPAYIRLLIQKLDTESKWIEFFAKAPVRKVSMIRPEDRQAG